MNRYSFFWIILFSIINSACTFPKPTKMKIKENLSFSCDVNTGFCSPDHEPLNNSILKVTSNSKPKLKIRYYYDALCGWCYGFSPVIKKLENTYKDQIDIDVISGGLFLGNRAGLVNDVAPHIKAGAYKSVELMTGVKFGASFLEDVFGAGKMELNSLPPTIALCIVREKYPEKELAFAATLLNAVYFDGIDPVDINAYVAYASEYGIDAEEFLTKMNNPFYEQMAINEFNTFRNSKYSGMPSIVVFKNDVEIPISKGYIGYDDLKVKLDQFID